MGINAITIGIWAAAGGTGSTPTTTNFYADPYWNNVTLLMHGDTLADSGPLALALTNTGVTVDTTTKKYGSGALYFDGNSYLTVPHNNVLSMTASDFTAECWISVTSLSGDYMPILDKSGVGSVTVNNWVLRVTPTGKLIAQVGISGYPGSVIGATYGATTLSLNTWYHVAFVKTGTTYKLYINGIQDGTATYSTTPSDGNPYPLTVGYEPGQASTYRFRGYVDDIRITSGVARYLTTFTPPTRAHPDKYGDIQSPYDPYFNNVVALLHNDSLLDSSGNAVALTNTNVAFVTTNGAFGAGSWYFNGAARMEGAASSNFNLYGVDMTIEAWVNLSSFTSNPYIVELFNYTAPVSRVIIQVNAAGTVSFHIDNAGTVFSLTSTVAIALNTNNHLAVSLSGTTARLFINGYLAASGTVSPVIADRICALNLGNYKAGNSNFATGFIDDVRITKGVARYTANFNPPTASFYDPTMGDPYWNYVTLLMNGDTLLDNSPSALALTNTGVTVNTTTKKYGSGSLYFNGSSGLKSSVDLPLYTSDFTIETWVYLPQSLTADIWIVGQGSATVSTYILLITSARKISWWDGVATTAAVGTTAIAINQWTHLAVARVAGILTFYLDGVACGTFTRTSNYATTTPKFTIGGSYDSRGYANCYIDDLRITKGVARYTANFTPPARALPLTIGCFTSPVTRGLILDLDNNADTSSQVFDRSSANRIGVNSGTTFVATPTGKKAMVCSGSNLVSFPDETAFRPAVFSVSFWIKTTTTDNLVIFEKDGNAGFSVQTSAATVPFGMTAGRIGLNTGGGVNSILYGSTVINDGNYHHAVVIGNGSSDKVYIDGVDVTVSATTGEPVYSTGPLYIGSRNGAYGFPGSLAHVRMFNVALTAAEVATLFNEKP